MTKKQLIKAMKGLDDEAEVRILIESHDEAVSVNAHEIYVENIITGDDVQNEIRLVAVGDF